MRFKVRYANPSLIFKIARRIATMFYKSGLTMLNLISQFARTQSFMPAKFAYVSQQCAVFVIRHANAQKVTQIFVGEL
jgi:hypothetical protein